MKFRDVVNQVAGDGQWHALHKFYIAYEQYILPRRALDRYLLERKNEPSDIPRAIMIGKWRIVSYRLTQLRASGHIDKRGIGIDSEYRLTK